MAQIESERNSGTYAEVDRIFNALLVSQRPLDVQTAGGKILGHYSAVGTTAAAAFAANADLAAFRWTDPTFFAVITRVWFSLQVATAVTAQRMDALLAYIARSYTARDATNATAVALTATNSQKLRSTFGDSLVGNIDVASAAAGISAGTKIPDTNPVSFAAISGAAAVAGLGTGKEGELISAVRPLAYPIVLQKNDGLLVRWGATAVATGTATLTVGFEWAEVELF